MATPKLPETHFVLCEYRINGVYSVCFDETDPGTSLASVVQRISDGDYAGQPLAVFRANDGAEFVRVTDEVCTMLMRQRYDVVWLSKLAIDFLSHNGHDIREAAE
jgi:hypothetical protein